MQHKSSMPGVVETPGIELKPFRIGSGDGLFLFPDSRRDKALRQSFAPCPSCGRELRLTQATVAVNRVEGRLAVCAACQSRVTERGLIG